MTIRWMIIMLLLSLESNSAFSQANLVKNGSFEIYSKCPSKADHILFATGWTPIDTTKYADSLTNHNCSADYCHECGTGMWNTIPFNGFGYQYPHSGKGMAAAWMYTDRDPSNTNDYLRDYLLSKLTQKLTAGKRYCVTFYVVLAETAQFAVKDIGAYFDNGSIITTSTCGMPKQGLTQQVIHSGLPISDTINWTKIEGSFVADGTEQFITIGNFKDKTGSTVIDLPNNGRNRTHGTYYFVDDVSVVESNTVAYAGPDTHVGAGDSIFIGRTDAAMDCTWTKLGSTIVIGTGAGIWVKPTITTNYVVTQTLCGVVTKDTVKIEIWAAGINNVGTDYTQQYSLFPNPNNGSMMIQQLIADAEPVQVKVYNSLGEVVYRTAKTFLSNRSGLDVKTLAPGMYYLILQDSAGRRYGLKFTKQ